MARCPAPRLDQARPTPASAWRRRSSSPGRRPEVISTRRSPRPRPGAGDAGGARRDVLQGDGSWVSPVPDGGRSPERGRAVAPDVEGRHGDLRPAWVRTSPGRSRRTPRGAPPLLAPSRWQTSMDSSPRRPRWRSPAPPPPTRPGEPAGPMPNSSPPVRHDVQGGDGPGHREGMAQPDVVDLGPEVDLLGLTGQEGQVGEDVVDRDVGRERRVVGSGEAAAGPGHRDDQVLGHPHRLEPQPVCLPGDLGPDAGRRPRARCRLHRGPRPGIGAASTSRS